MVFLLLLALFAFLGFLLPLFLFLLRFFSALLPSMPPVASVFPPGSLLAPLVTQPLPSFYPLAPTVAPVVSYSSSLPSFAPPGFPLAPPVRPFPPAIGPRPFLPLVTPAASSLFSVSSLLTLAVLLSSSFPSGPLSSVAPSFPLLFLPLPACHLFWLFGFGRLVVALFGRLFYCSLLWYRCRLFLILWFLLCFP